MNYLNMQSRTSSHNSSRTPDPRDGFWSKALSYVALPRILVLWSSVFASAFFASIHSVNGQSMFEFTSQWGDGSPTAVDLSYLNDHEAGQQGWIVVDNDGHLATSAGRIRFWGANLNVGANFPDQNTAPKAAAHLAKLGYNIVRHHHIDVGPSGIWTTGNPDLTFDSAKLDKFDYFVSQLRANGIYSNINLLTARPFNGGADPEHELDLVAEKKARAILGMFDPELRELQKDFAADLLNHINPYTELAYRDDPGVAMIEIINENSLPHAFKRRWLDDLPSYYDELLNDAWVSWLGGQYVNHLDLMNDWVIEENYANNLLLNGDFSQGNNDWVLHKAGNASASTNTYAGGGPDNGPYTTVTTNQVGSNAWDVQLQQYGITITQDEWYFVSYKVRADAVRPLNANVSLSSSPYTALGYSKSITLNTDWQTCTHYFKATGSSVNARIRFSDMGAILGTVSFADVIVREAGVTGSEMLVNGNFSEGDSNWVMQLLGMPTASAFASTGNEGPAGTPAGKVTTAALGQSGNHVQVFQKQLAVEAGKVYTVKLKAKADTTRTLHVSVMMDSAPYSKLGLDETIMLNSDWQDFSFTFVAADSHTNARVNIGGMGTILGTVWLTDVSMAPGGMAGLEEGDDLDINSIPNFTSNLKGRNAKAWVDWYAFLLDLEKAYYEDMKTHIRTIIGSQSLLVGSQLGFACPNNQAMFDIIDSHTYWRHPKFPTNRWDPVDWYVTNEAMINNPFDSSPSQAACRAIFGKPVSISEFNSSFPNNYEAEILMLMTTYGSLNDVDALFPFSYNGDADWSAKLDNLDTYFEMDENPLKQVSSITAALTFRRHDFSPALETIVVSLDEDVERSLLPGAPAMIDASSVGVDDVESLIHGVRIAVEGQTIPTGSLEPGTTSISGPIYTSDTNELVWDTTYNDRGAVLVNSPRTRAVIGFVGSDAWDLGDVAIAPGDGILDGFSVITLTSLDGEDVDASGQLLLTALGGQKNSGLNYKVYPSTSASYPLPYGERVSFDRNQSAQGVTLVEGINASITIPHPTSCVTVHALDGNGERLPVQIPVTPIAGGLTSTFVISDAFQTLWYEIEVASVVPLSGESSYSDQDKSGGLTSANDETSASLTGNAWKKINWDTILDADSILCFDFKSSNEGELQGIGMDEDNSHTNNLRLFQLAGEDTWSNAIQNYATYQGNVWQHYEIPIGTYYTGAMSYLVLFSDDDADENSHCEFRNVHIK